MADRLRWLFLVGLALFGTGCYRQTFINERVAPNGREDSSTKVFGIFGLVGDGEVNAAETCKEGVHSVTWRAGFVDVLVSTVTLGLVGLRSVDVKCGTPSGGATK